MATNPLASIFGRNPFNALQEHMHVVRQCVDLVPALFEALAAKDQARIEHIKEHIFETEEQADRVKNKLREHLPRGLFLPVNRRDLLEILDFQDSIADVAQDIAGLLVERSMEIPEPMVDSLLPFVQVCVDVCHQAGRVIEQLDELLEVGFRGREATHVEELINQINAREEESDKMGLELARMLFRHEDEMRPVSVIFWYRLLEWIGDLADNAEKVGNRLRLLIAR